MKSSNTSSQSDKTSGRVYPFQYDWDLGKVEKMLKNCISEVENLEAKIQEDLVTIMSLRKQVEEYKSIIQFLCENRKEEKYILERKFIKLRKILQYRLK